MFTVKKGKVFVQSNLSEFVDIHQVALGKIRRIRRELTTADIETGEFKEVEDSIVEEIQNSTGVLNTYFHVDNDYWNTVLDRSSHREKDWTEVSPK